MAKAAPQTSGDVRLSLPEALKQIRWNESGLVPVVTQDAKSNKVLMMAWMNEEALTKTLATGDVHYYSRSRQKLWRKGETSGHTQKLTDLRVDCDADTLLAKVVQTGVACHTGRPSCFYQQLEDFS